MEESQRSRYRDEAIGHGPNHSRVTLKMILRMNQLAFYDCPRPEKVRMLSICIIDYALAPSWQCVTRLNIANPSFIFSIPISFFEIFNRQLRPSTVLDVGVTLRRPYQT